MRCTEILHIIGDAASVVTVIGGFVAFCNWIQSRKAKIVVDDFQSDGDFFDLYLCNIGNYPARNITLFAPYKYDLQGNREIDILQPGERGQMGLHCRVPFNQLPVTLRWSDGMGRHRKRIRNSKMHER